MEIGTGLKLPVVQRQSVAPKESALTDDRGALPEDSHHPDAERAVGPLTGDAGQRVGRFVRGVAYESMQQARYLAGAAAFNNVGSAIGSLVATPIAIKLAADNAAVVGGVAIGGTVALGAVGGILGYLWVREHDSLGAKETKPSLFGKVADAGIDAASMVEALPKFIYPSVYGANAAETKIIYDALDKLPLEDATASSTMTLVPELLDTGISGMSQPGASHVRILLDKSWINNPARAEGLVFHENGHAVDYSGGFGLLGSNNWKGAFGKGPFISDYAKSNRYEDWAETYEQFHSDPSKLSGMPEKLKIVERVNEQDPLSRAADTAKVRNAGKNIGKELAKVPYLRDTLEVAGSLIGPIQIFRGAGDVIKGWENDDKEASLRGKMNLATGLFLTLPGASPLALATSTAGNVIKYATKSDDPASVELADRAANVVLGTAAGPVGMALAAVTGELAKNGLHFDESQGFSAAGWKSARPDKSDMLKGALFTVGGAVGGSIAGASLGAYLNGASGAAVGGAWGQVAGVVGGIALYGTMRTIKSAHKTKDPLRLTKADKKFLLGLTGGALVGGGVGTGVGTYAGRLAGQLLGGLVAGPAGASAGQVVGGWGGALAGAFGGAKIGAAIGSGRLFGKGMQGTSGQTLARPEVVAQNSI